jgi:hypothetical protein
MSELKPKCSACNERDVFSKGLCSGCYGRKWRDERKAERAAKIAAEFPLKQLSAGDAGEEVIEGEIVHDEPPRPAAPDTHLVATNPAEMQAAQGDLKEWLEGRLTVLERDIIEANAALNEARKNGWATAALTSARNRAVDEETFYNKILLAVEAGYTMIPDFPIQVFAVRRGEQPREETRTFVGWHKSTDTGLGQPVPPDYAPVGAGEYRNPLPATWGNVREDKTATPENKRPRYYTTVTRYSHPAAPVSFPSTSARSPVMKATAKAMKEKTFDQIGICLPTRAVAGGRQVQQGARAGDPLIIGQVVGKRVGSRQKIVSFIIAWHLNMEEL